MASQTTPSAERSSSNHQTAENSNENLWVEALESLDAGDCERLQPLAVEGITVLEEVFDAANEESRQCQDRQRTCTNNDRMTIVLRDVFDKIATWLTKLQALGDFVQFD